MKILRISFLFCGVLLFSQETVSNYDFPKIKSGLVMPVRIPLSEVSAMVNSTVKDLIFEDNSYSDNNNDQFKVKVWKTRPIRIVGGTKQNLLIEVPLKIWAEKGIGTLGVYSYQNTTFETVMYFNSAVNFNNNWTAVTSTKPMGFKWITKPVLDFGKIEIPITPIVEKSLKEQQEKFCKTMDEQMSKQLNFQTYAVMAWNLFADPIQVSEEYNTWLKVTPISVSVTPLKFYGDAIDSQIGIDTYSETFTGSKPASDRKITTIANFNSVQNLPQKFLLQTTANIPFTEATAIAQKMFLNKEFDFQEGKSKVKITDVNVYSDLGRVMIEAKTEGKVDGTSYISGIPVYDAAKRKIVLSDTKFKLKTRNFLHKAGTVLFQGKIVKMIEEEYGIPTAEMENSAKENLMKSFNSEYRKGIKMQGNVTKIVPSKVLTGQSALTVVVDTEAQMRLTLGNFLN